MRHIFSFTFLICITIFTASGCKSRATVATQTLDSSSSGENSPQYARFKPWIKALQQPLDQSASAGEAADALIKSADARIASFNLQALCRLYSDTDEKFKKYKDHFKDLEDGIGKYDMWNNVLKAAQDRHAPNSKIQQLKAKLNQARDELKQSLKDNEWVATDEPRLKKFTKFLKEFNWQGQNSDRKDMLKQLISQLGKINDNQYDMSKLEEGFGLHELRRQMRWFLIEARVLNGMVVFKGSNSCPNNAYAALPNKPIAQSKYSQLPSSDAEPDPCKISQCLFLGAVDAVNEIGIIKDEVESANNVNSDGNDAVPEAARKKAEKIYNGMVENKLIPQLIDELKQCKEDL